MNAIRNLLDTDRIGGKIMFTIMAVVIYRIGALIPSPGIDYGNLRACVVGYDSTLFSTVNMFSGGSLGQLSLFSIGVLSYVTAAITFQLLAVIVPKLAELKKDGERGQTKINQYSRYLTMVLAIVQASVMYYMVSGPQPKLFNCGVPVLDTGIITMVGFITALAAGAMILMWIGERITERGLGNGISILLYASIATGLPVGIAGLGVSGDMWKVIGGIAALVVLLGAVVYVEQAQRRLPVGYTQNAGTQVPSYMPLKVNLSGVVPVIYASSLLSLPTMVAAFLGPEHGFSSWVQKYLTSGTTLTYMGVYLGLVVAFTFFQTYVTHDPNDLSDKLKESSGYIPGKRAGSETADYLNFVIIRLTTAGAIYLAAVAVLPLLILDGLAGASAGNLPLGGTALLILVGVAIETTRAYVAKKRIYSAKPEQIDITKRVDELSRKI